MSDTDYLKCSCQKCGGHIEFPASGTGERVDCPHCGEQLTLIPGAEKSSGKPVKKFAIVVGLIFPVVVLVAAGVIFYGSKMQKPVVSSRITAAPAVTNAPPPETFIELNDFKISEITLRKSGDGGLEYAVGTVKNDTTRQRFGVKLELDLLNDQDVKIGSASDYIAVIEPHKEWQFRALLTETTAVKATLTNIEEQK